MAEPTAPEPEYAMVMPFVVVTSKGGPYDDDAYVAGYQIGTLDRDLLAAPAQHQVTIRTDNVPQADLVGMRNGYTSVTERSTELPEWTFMTFRPMTATEPADA